MIIHVSKFIWNTVGPLKSKSSVFWGADKEGLTFVISIQMFSAYDAERFSRQGDYSFFYGLVNVLRTRIDMVWLFSDNGKLIKVLTHNLTSNQ